MSDENLLNETKEIAKADTPKSLAKDVELWGEAVEDAGGYGDENIDNEDLKYPRLKIVQPSTKEKGEAKDGDIVEVISGENYGDSIQVIPLNMWKSRVLFDDDYHLQCGSPDSLTSNSGDKSGTKCVECPESKWGDNNEKPPCNLQYNFAVAEVSQLKDAVKNKAMLPPLVINMSGANSTAAKEIQTALRMMTRKTNRPIFAFVLELKTDKGKSNKGSYYVYKFSIKNVPSEYAGYLTELYKQYQKVNIDDVEIPE